MWRFTLAGISAAILGLAAYSLAHTSAYACTPPGPGFDAFGLSSLVIEGRITGWGVPPESPNEGLLPIVLQMDVERVWKGLGGRSVTVVDHDSLVWSRGEATWGPGGLCSAFYEDPTGSYVILGLTQRDDGTYQPGLWTTFFRGDGPEGERYESAVAYLAGRQAGITLPSTGAGPARSTPTHHLGAVIAIVGATLLAASFAIRFGARRQP